DNAVATHLRSSVGRQWRALRRAQRLETFGCLAECRLEIADAEADQACLHAIDDARALTYQVFTFAVRALGVLLFEGRNSRHAAVIRFASQPAEKHALQQFRVEAVGFGAPVFT